MRIIGLDISRGSATAFLLEERPTNPTEFAQSLEFISFTIEANHGDLQGLVDLSPDFVVIEPTGYHYERLIVNWLERNGITVKQVTGWRASIYRSSLGFNDKTDPIDALTLAIYGWDKWDDPKAWVPRCELHSLRQLWLQRDGLIRLQTRFVQRLKQQLQHEFPECSNFDLDRSWGEEPHGLILWLAGDAGPYTNSRYNNQHDGGIIRRSTKQENGQVIRKREQYPGTVGSKVSDYSRFMGQELINLAQAQLRIERECTTMLESPPFEMYRAAFQEIGFSDTVQVIWLTRIYPFERFLVEGRADIIKKRSKNGRLVTCDRSLAQFKAALGAGMRLDTSGVRQAKSDQAKSGKWHGRQTNDRPAEIPIGDKFSRKAFFMWSLAQVETKKLKSPKADQLFEKRDSLKAAGRNLYQRSGNLHGYAARLLYRELLKRT